VPHILNPQAQGIYSNDPLAEDETSISFMENGQFTGHCAVAHSGRTGLISLDIDPNTDFPDMGLPWYE
jgi:uncharacterized protein (DUF952 family)